MKIYIHTKTGNEYRKIGVVKNATNENDGQIMVLYTRNGHYYVREVKEFNEKFKKVE
jgi:hypothetical protein